MDPREGYPSVFYWLDDSAHEHLDVAIMNDLDLKRDMLISFEEYNFDSSYVKEFIEYLEHKYDWKDYGEMDLIYDLILSDFDDVFNFEFTENKFEIFLDKFNELQGYIEETLAYTKWNDFIGTFQDYRILEFDIKMHNIRCDIENTEPELETIYYSQQLEDFHYWVEDKADKYNFNLVDFRQEGRQGGRLILEFDNFISPDLIEDFITSYRFEQLTSLGDAIVQLELFIKKANNQIEFIKLVEEELKSRKDYIENYGLCSFIKNNIKE